MIAQETIAKLKMLYNIRENCDYFCNALYTIGKFEKQ